MRSPSPQFRFHAVSMELSAHFDARRVDMHIVTDDGTAFVIEYEKDALMSVQRDIQQLIEKCPEIATWK